MYGWMTSPTFMHQIMQKYHGDLDPVVDNRNSIYNATKILLCALHVISCFIMLLGVTENVYKMV